MILSILRLIAIGALTIVVATELKTDARAQDSESTKPGTIPAVRERMRGFIDKGEIAGAVTLVADSAGIVHLDASGFADIADQKPMRPDTIFWIASMTKPVTATAVMMLADEGKLSADDLVEEFIPEFARIKTSKGEPAKLTIRHLLTHTSGMAEATTQEMRRSKTLAEMIPIYASKTLRFDPGSKWEYCQSSINTAGRVVEVLSGTSFDQFLERRLFQPLSMKDTTFYVADDQLPRLATSYQRTSEGKLDKATIRFLMGKPPTSRDRFPAPNGGLFSTALDYARFCRMILNGGELDGKRYLKSESVAYMTSLKTGDLKTGFTEGCGWGLGWCVVREPKGITAMLSPGTFGHGGAYGTQAWIDPGQKRIYLLMVQRSNFPNSDASDVRRGFQEAATGHASN
jgi:CubicO group peptidase (beta-lactamase class C family)